MPQGVTAGSRNNSVSYLPRNYQSLYKGGCRRDLWVPGSAPRAVRCCPDSPLPSGCEVAACGVVTCVSLMNGDAELIFMRLWAIRASSLEQCLLQPFEVADFGAQMLSLTWNQWGHCPSPTNPDCHQPSGHFLSLAKDQRGEGAIAPQGPPLPRFPRFSVTAAVARTRGPRFLTVWVTTRSRPARD